MSQTEINNLENFICQHNLKNLKDCKITFWKDNLETPYSERLFRTLEYLTTNEKKYADYMWSHTSKPTEDIVAEIFKKRMYD